MSSLEPNPQWSSELAQKWQRLLQRMRHYGGCVVAFSGGVDSATVAAVAYRVLGSRAVAVTAQSESLSQYQRQLAAQVAQQIGIRHLWIDTQEVQDPRYQANTSQRCYYCKSELYAHLTQLAKQWNLPVVVNGTNADDQGDWRPGLQAAEQFGVKSPLLECGIGKREVRQMARWLGLSVWDEPASPCLSSRVAYHVEVTPERLRRIEQAEAFLRSRGFHPVRVRLHPGELARVEVPPEFLPRLISSPLREELAQHFRQLGFAFVTVDVEGLRSGSLNQLVPLLSKPSSPSGSD